MHQERLNDAAVALHRVLSTSNIKFGVFGGYAIGVLGGPRESKDIDCLAAVSKQGIIGLLNGKEGFVVVNQGRTDYVAFLWSDKADRSNAVLVEIFCEQFPGALYSMRNIQPVTRTIRGRINNGPSSFLEPFLVFKGKLSAAADRAKFHDSADLRWLENRFNQQIRVRSRELDISRVGLAIKRYPELERVFQRLGVNIDDAKRAAAHLSPSSLPRPAPGDVQKNILA